MCIFLDILSRFNFIKIIFFNFVILILLVYLFHFLTIYSLHMNILKYNNDYCVTHTTFIKL